MILNFLESLTNQTTRLNYTSDLRQFAMATWQLPPMDTAYDPLDNVTDEQWQAIGPDEIRAYIAHAKEVGLSDATVARRVTAIKSFLDHLAALGLYGEADLGYIKSRIKEKPGDSGHHSYVKADDQNKLLEAAANQPGLKGLRNYLIVRLLLETGVRRFELLNLRCKNLALYSGVPSVFVETAKNKKSRSIPISKELYDRLHDWLSETGQGESPDNPIFCRVRERHRGEEDYMALTGPKPLSSSFLNQMVGNLVKEAGIESKVTPHSFRVSAITDAAEAEAPLPHIQQMSGHSDTRMITSIYNRHRYNVPLPRKHKLFSPKGVDCSQKKGQNKR